MCSFQFSTYMCLFLFWQYLTRGLIWHLSQSSIRLSIYFSLMWNHARIHSWNRPVLSSKGNNSCWRKQRGPLMGLESDVQPTDSVVVVHQDQLISHTLLKFWQIRVLGISGWSESRFMCSPLNVQKLISLYQRIPQLNETSTLISVNENLSCYNSSYVSI